MATKNTSKSADDWNKALSSWTKKPAVTTTKATPKKKNTSTSDRLRDTQLGKTQTVQQRPVSTSDRLRPVNQTQGPATREEAKKKKKKSSPAADPFAAALDTWRSKVVEPQQQQKRVQYEVPERKFDYGIDRVDTRPGQFTSQQQQSPTRTTTVQPYDPNTAQGPQERPTGINAWLPKNFAFNAPVGALAAANIISDPEKRQQAGQLLNAGLQGWGSLINRGYQPYPEGQQPNGMEQAAGAAVNDIRNSAAMERLQYNNQQMADADAARNAPTWDDWAAAMPSWEKGAPNRKAMMDAWNAWQSGDKNAYQALEQYMSAPGSDPVPPLLTQYGRPTEWLERQSQNVLGGMQMAQDYMNTGFDVGNDLPIGPNMASAIYTIGERLWPAEWDKEVERVTPELIQRKATEWYKTFQKYTQQYRDAVQPDAIQQGLQQGPGSMNSPTAQAMNRERSFLNWADPESVAKTYDALTNQQTTVNELNQKANQAWQEGALSTSEAARDELWRQAADAGNRAYQLEHSHPQQLVNENTNIMRQLLMEVVQPDVTDVIGKIWSLTGMTPAARRLTRVADEVATPAEKVIRALDEMVVTGENAASVAAQRSTYNKALNLWTTGRARANIATDDMLRYTVNLLGDVETPRDAAYLLTQLATDPRKLITGVPGAGFQSPGLIARMDEKGLVRFGGMNIQRIKEPLRIFQQAAQNILASPVLKDGPILNKVDFVTTFMDEMNQAGYRFYNVAIDSTDVPTSAASGRIVGVGSRQYVVEYLDANKKVISKSKPVTMAEANKLKKAAASTTKAQKSFLGEVGALQRAIVSPFYILSSPGTWATNIIGGLATAAGDGMVSLRSSKYIDEWIGKQFGVDPTSRGFASVKSAGSSASQVSGKGPFKFLKRAYGQIDEQVGKRVYYSAANKALRQVGKNTLTATLTPILQAAGVAEKDARRIVTHLYETGLQGGDLTSEFNKLLNGQTKILNLSDVNPTWLDAIPPDRIEALNNIIRTAPSRDAAVKALQQWGQETAQYWDELIASGPSALPRYVWMKKEVLQDAADIKQAANMATKYGDVPAEVAQATTKQLADEMTATQARMQTLSQLVTESADPKNRYILYNIWGQVNDLTAGVRHQLLEMADAANGLSGAAKSKAWQEYWAANDRLWKDRNLRVNQLLEEGSAALGNGQQFAPRWDILERTASQNEAKLWETMKLEPASGRYDTRLKQVIDAGRAISDRALARTYAAAIRFIDVDAMDFIVSAEHNVQMAGAQANRYLEKAREVALKANTPEAWDKFFQTRNEVRRQQRVYERAVWEQATRHITEEGIALEAKGGAAVVEQAAQATDDLSGYYSAPKPKPAEALPANTNQAIDDYLAQNAAANPYPPEATAIIDEATFNANVERLAAADVGFPGSRALEEAEGLRAERAAATASGGAETRAQIRAEWDRVAKGQGGYLSIDRAVRSYTRNGIVNVPENKFEDLYGRTIAGQRIDNQADVDRLLQQYYDMSPQRKAAPTNDLNALRTAARDAGIPTLTDAGRPMDKRLVNTINKDLGLKLRGLRDLTPEQYTAAMEALAKRATPTPAVASVIEQAAQVADDVATPAQIAEYKALPRATVKGMFDADLRSLGYSDEAIARMSVSEMVDNALGNAAPVAEVAQEAVQAVVQPSARAVKAAEKSTPEIIAAVADELQRLAPASSGESISLYDVQQALQARGLEWDEASLALRDMQLDGGVTLMRQDDPQLITSLQRQGRYAEIVVGDDARQVVYPKPALAEYIEPEMRTYDFTIQALDPEKVAKALNFGGWWGKDAAKESADLLRRTTEAGGATAGELAHGAAFAKQQLENILTYMENNMDEILQPGQRMIGQGSNLRALEEFRKNVLPAWDNVKYAASEYGNRMRSFTMVDFANQTRLDEILGLYMPYGFWMTRTAKNSLERAIFQPQIWRRVMQAEREIRAIQEQQDAPQRYEGAFPIMSVDGVQQWLRVLPSKYWPAAGIFTSNDYADPESANSALGYAAESARAANLSPYPWWDAAIKIKENLAGGDKWNNDIYWANYLPQGRIAADLAIKYLGPEAAQYIAPGYFENSVARTLNNMAVKGEITREQARWAHDYLWQLKQGGEELPDAQTGAYDPKAIEAILDKAMRATAGVDLNTAITSWATGMSVRPFDTAEQQWSGAAQNYRDYKYGERNPYGSKAAADTQKPDAALSWSKAGVWRPEEQRPGVSMATDAKSAEKDALNAELMAATDEFITNFNGTPKNFEIDNFKKAWVAERTGGDPKKWLTDNMDAYLEKKYPSATTFDGENFNYQGYAPEEIQIKARTAAYYKAKDEFTAPVKPEYPGDNATRAQYNTYFTAKDKYDADKVAYDKAIVDRVAELINDPVALQELIGRAPQPGPQTYMDYVMGQFRPLSMDNVFGYPVRPTGGGAYNYGLTDLAGDAETAPEIVQAEKTKYMSELEKQVRAANEANGDRGGRSYRGRGYSNRRYSSGRRGYSRRYYGGGGGGGGGGSYYVPNVEGRGLSEWLSVDPERIAYRAPNQVRVNPPDIGPKAIKAWKKLIW